MPQKGGSLHAPVGPPQVRLSPPRRAAPALLLTMVLAIATTGLVYELVMAAVASYVLGDSVRQFSTIIGLYLSALGAGAYLSRYIDRALELRFIDVELAAALVGGLSAPLLFAAFSVTAAFQAALYATVLSVGVLVGLELPLLMRILRQDLNFKDLVAKALTFDYAGALLGSLGFSLILMPYLGLVRTSLACGFVNALVAFFSTWALCPSVEDEGAFRAARWRALVVVALLLTAFTGSEHLTAFCEQHVFGKVSAAIQSPYQRIVLTEEGEETAMFLNGALQFSSKDERRYHEALVHPAMGASVRRDQVLIAGGGDGLAARETLRWRDVQRVTLVDLDAKVTELAASNPALRRLNDGALDDPRLHIVHADAMQWLATTKQSFDVAILDFPDPSNYALGKLYSRRMYRLIRQRLNPGASLAVQATSPHATRRAYWCIVATLESEGFVVSPYRAFVPAFGEWGFALARLSNTDSNPTVLPSAGLSYLSPQIAASLHVFARDTSRSAVMPQTLEGQQLVSYYLEAHRAFR